MTHKSGRQVAETTDLFPPTTTEFWKLGTVDFRDTPARVQFVSSGLGFEGEIYRSFHVHCCLGETPGVGMFKRRVTCAWIFNLLVCAGPTSQRPTTPNPGKDVLLTEPMSSQATVQKNRRHS